IGVDERPISSFGCDGVVMATPTGSTAYAFSGGGPIVWPEVKAMLMVPLSAHALFSRPMVVSPESVISVDVLQRTNESGVLWCDGRRTVDLPAGARIEVTRSASPVKLARLAMTPFSERLVRKFDLPTDGWRGTITDQDRAAMQRRRQAQRDEEHWHQTLADSHGVRIVEPHHAAPRPEIVPPVTTPVPVVTKEDEEDIIRLPNKASEHDYEEPRHGYMLEHLSINSLGVIEETTVEFDPGFTVVTGETGAGKTMVVSALALLLGARADAGAIRPGEAKATVEAGFILD